MCAQGLSLDVLLAPGISTLLPNLQVLSLDQCVLTPAARTTVLDAACNRLRHLEITGLALPGPPQPATAGAAPSQPAPSLQQLATAQLRQLAKLPSLSSIRLLDSSCPTLFLVALGTHLTRLWLHESCQQCEPGTQTPTPAWRATLQHVARCTRLRELNIPCNTAGELGLVAPALQQLRTLRLTHPWPLQTDGDAVVEVLLGLPHLTSLHWHSPALHTLGRWYTDHPCSWQQLTLPAVTVQQLARLPLHSLTQPVLFGHLAVPPVTSLHEVRAAVANVTQRCPAGFRWDAPDSGARLSLTLLPGQEPAFLRVLQPLLASVTGLEMDGFKCDAEVLKALGEVLPHMCTRLELSFMLMPGDALEQVARSLPWVQTLRFKGQSVAPWDVVGYVRLKEQGSEGAAAGRLKEVVVERPVRPKGVSEGVHKKAWEQAVRQVEQEGAGVVLRVVW